MESEDKAVIRSADGLWAVRLHKAIKKPVTKVKDCWVAVYEATLLKSPSWTTEDTEEAEREGIEASEDFESGVPDRVPDLGEPGEISESEHAFVFGPPSPTQHADAVEKPEEKEEEIIGQNIIVKVFTVGPKGDKGRSTNEISALRQLKQAGCTHAPNFLGNFEKIEKSRPNGIVRYVLMTKLPGYSLDNRQWQKPLAGSWKVKEALRVALRDVHSCGFNNGSPFLRNAMWDAEAGECYIVDFERANVVKPGGISERWQLFGRMAL